MPAYSRNFQYDPNTFKVSQFARTLFYGASPGLSGSSLG